MKKSWFVYLHGRVVQELSGTSNVMFGRTTVQETVISTILDFLILGSTNVSLEGNGREEVTILAMICF